MSLCHPLLLDHRHLHFLCQLNLSRICHGEALKGPRLKLSFRSSFYVIFGFDFVRQGDSVAIIQLEIRYFNHRQQMLSLMWDS